MTCLLGCTVGFGMAEGRAVMVRVESDLPTNHAPDFFACFVKNFGALVREVSILSNKMECLPRACGR